MTDVYSKRTRSYVMSRVRSVNTKPETLVRKFLFSNGFRYKLHASNLPGKPDIVLRKYNTVIFVNGCFWHNHNGCKRNRMPASRQEYWLPKIMRNKERDRTNHKALKKSGWNVIVIWECALAKNKIDTTLASLLNKIPSLPFYGNEFKKAFAETMRL